MIADDAPFRWGQLGEIQRVLRVAAEQDFEWLSHGRVPGQKPDQVYNPWMPFQTAEFVAMLTECVAECDGPDFLDIGSGIGTKLMLATYIFGLTCEGIEIDEAMSEFANKHHRTTITYDALKFDMYGNYDIIWMYRPFKDGFKQAQLEHTVFEQMKPGAIVAGDKWETRPPGFDIILEDWGPGVKGAFRKPANWTPVTVDFKE